MDDQRPMSDESEAFCRTCEEYLTGWKRAQADYANLQRERERDRSEYVKYANASLLQSLLPAIDQFSVAMRFLPETTTLPEEARQVWESWLMGLKAVYSLWEQTAQSIGLERIEARGKFDPTTQEAVSQEEKEGIEPETILRVVRDGWKLHGKLLRPAQIIMAK